MLRKSAGDPRMGGLIDPLAGRAVSCIRQERWASRNCRRITHRGITKTGPGSSQGAWIEIKGHKNWREVQPVSNHEDSQAD